jgi:alpha-galactosidase
VTAVNGSAVAPATSLLTAGGTTFTAAVQLHNDGTTPVASPSVTLHTPDGWSAKPVGTQPQLVRPGGSAEADFSVSVPVAAGVGGYDVSADVAFSAAQGRVVVDSPALRVTIAPPPPSGAGFALSHQPWISATSGWMSPAIDQSVGGGNPIRVAGTVYPTGLGVASPSDITYYLGGQCTRLTGVVGIDDVVDNVGPEGGTATFSVAADGTTLWDSGVVARGAGVPFSVDLTGAQVLVLHVGDAGDGGYNDRADWAAPTVDCQ